MYEDGWKVVTNHVNQLTHAERELIDGSSDFAEDHWHLFDARTDMAENRDVGAEHPEIRDRLIARWHEEADRNGVLPLSDGVMDRLAHLFLPWPTGSPRVELRPGERVFEDNTPVLCNGFTITAHLAAPIEPGGAGCWPNRATTTAAGSGTQAEGTLTFACSYVSEYVTRLTVDLPVGASTLRLVGRPDGDGVDMVCDADGEVVGRVRLPHAWPGLWTPNSVGVAARRRRAAPAGVRRLRPAHGVHRSTGPSRRRGRRRCRRSSRSSTRSRRRSATSDARSLMEIIAELVLQGIFELLLEVGSRGLGRARTSVAARPFERSPRRRVRVLRTDRDRAGPLARRHGGLARVGLVVGAGHRADRGGGGARPTGASCGSPAREGRGADVVAGGSLRVVRRCQRHVRGLLRHRRGLSGMIPAFPVVDRRRAHHGGAAEERS